MAPLSPTCSVARSKSLRAPDLCAAPTVYKVLALSPLSGFLQQAHPAFLTDEETETGRRQAMHRESAAWQRLTQCR